MLKVSFYLISLCIHVLMIIFCTGQRTTPSIVAFADNDQRLVGIPAKRQVSELNIAT